MATGARRIARSSGSFLSLACLCVLLVAGCAQVRDAAAPPPGEAAAPEAKATTSYAPSTPALDASVAAGMPRLPAFFVGVNVYDLAADRPEGYECNVPTGEDADQVLDQTFATLKADGVQVIRFWAFQTYGTDDQTGERYWGAFDKVMQKGLQYGIYLIPVLDNHWRDCNRLRTVTASLARRASTVSAQQWTEQFAERYGSDPAVYAFEVQNEPLAISPDETAVQSLRDDLKRRVDAVKAHSDKPVGLGDVGATEAGFAGSAFDTTYQYAGATIATGHDYQGWDAAETGCGLDAGQCRNIEAAKALGLPFYFGEGGSRACDDEHKADVLRHKIEAASRAGAVGYLLWDFSLRAPATSCGFDVGPGGSVIKVLGSF